MSLLKENSHGYSRGTAIAGGLLVDISNEAQEVGLSYPVAVTASLAKNLRPNEFLSSLGISFEDQTRMLLQLIRERIVPHPEGIPEENEGEKLIVPFIVLKGPLIKEELISVLVMVHDGDDGEPVITLMNPEVTSEAA
jgi:hypothetical protein